MTEARGSVDVAVTLMRMALALLDRAGEKAGAGRLRIAIAAVPATAGVTGDGPAPALVRDAAGIGAQ